MIYPIIKLGDPVLEKVSEPVTEFNKELEKLVEDLWETMYAANGVGLAAPQIGISKSLCVIDTHAGTDEESGEELGEKLVLVNPVIDHLDGKEVLEEGCLSLPTFRANTSRATRATIRAQDLQGNPFTLTGEGLLARAFQHEIDHLNGILYIRHISMLKRESIKRQIKRRTKAGKW